MILLVDDDAALVDTCYMLLQMHGFEVSVARDAQDALVQMSWQTPELIISDWVMPGMDGIELAHHIQKNDAWRRIPFILMSGSLPRTGGALPCDGFLRKPFLAQTLMDLVTTVTAPSNARSAGNGGAQPG